MVPVYCQGSSQYWKKFITIFYCQTVRNLHSRNLSINFWPTQTSLLSFMLETPMKPVIYLMVSDCKLFTMLDFPVLENIVHVLSVHLLLLIKFTWLEVSSWSYVWDIYLYLLNWFVSLISLLTIQSREVTHLATYEFNFCWLQVVTFISFHGQFTFNKWDTDRCRPIHFLVYICLTRQDYFGLSTSCLASVQ